VLLIYVSYIFSISMMCGVQSTSDTAIQVLLLIDQFYAGYGGTEQHLLFLLRTLPSRRVEPHFAVLSGIRRCDPMNFPVSPVILSEACLQGPIGLCRRILRLASLISSRRVDVVHTFCPISEIAALVATRLARRGKVLGVRRNVGYWHNFWTLGRARLVRFLGAQYVANCMAAREYSVAAEWIPHERISVIYNPVAMQRLNEGLAQVPDRTDLGIRNGDHVVGMVATVRPVKDYATFLQAARLVLNRFPKTAFVAVGHPVDDYLAELQKLAAELRIESHISWLGAVQNPFSLLPHFDIGVLSSLSEGFSNALLEYSAAGIPIVATEVGGTSEIVVNGQTGFLVQPQNAKALADRICTLLENQQLRKQFGSKARERTCALFSQEACLDAYVALYERLANNHTPTSIPAAVKD
jgi:L-malate glycosyltransferase